MSIIPHGGSRGGWVGPLARHCAQYDAMAGAGPARESVSLSVLEDEIGNWTRCFASSSTVPVLYGMRPNARVCVNIMYPGSSPRCL
jgi:hypothetical protein